MIISILIPTYNEEDNVEKIYERVTSVFRNNLPQYDYEIIYIDNCSTDETRNIIACLADKDNHVKAIFNARNFGFTRSQYYGLTQTTGDCTILIFADMQEPPELIVDFIKEWENGSKLVLGVKNKSNENRLVYFIRSCYYKLIAKISEVDHIEHFTGFGLYDKSFIEVLRSIDDPQPYLRGIVAEFGYKIKKIFYTQEKRRFGKSSFNFLRLYDLAMLGITSYTRSLLRLATFISSGIGILSILFALFTIVMKIFGWGLYPAGTASILCVVSLIGAIQLFFIGLLGEYIMSINTRSLRRPLVIEEKRINLEK